MGVVREPCLSTLLEIDRGEGVHVKGVAVFGVCGDGTLNTTNLELILLRGHLEMATRHWAFLLLRVCKADSLAFNTHHVLAGEDRRKVVDCVEGVHLEANLTHHSFETLL